MLHSSRFGTGGFARTGPDGVRRAEIDGTPRPSPGSAAALGRDDARIQRFLIRLQSASILWAQAGLAPKSGGEGASMTVPNRFCGLCGRHCRVSAGRIRLRAALAELGRLHGRRVEVDVRGR